MAHLDSPAEWRAVVLLFRRNRPWRDNPIHSSISDELPFVLREVSIKRGEYSAPRGGPPKEIRRAIQRRRSCRIECLSDARETLPQHIHNLRLAHLCGL